MNVNDIIDIIKTSVRPETIFINLTPEIAEYLLTVNKVNRPIKPAPLQQRISDIKHNTWRVTGESIKINKDGFLIDGQHRCTAVKETGISIEIAITFGLDASIQRFLDKPSVRTTADDLHIEGLSNTVSIASSVKQIISYEKSNNFSGYKAEISSEEIFQFAINNRDWLEFVVKNASIFSRKTFTQPRIIVLSTWAISKEIAKSNFSKFYSVSSKDMIDTVYLPLEFWESCANKIGWYENDPRKAMVERFEKDKKENIKLPLPNQMSIIIRCYNKYRQKDILKRILVSKKEDGKNIPIDIPSIFIK